MSPSVVEATLGANVLVALGGDSAAAMVWANAVEIAGDENAGESGDGGLGTALTPESFAIALVHQVGEVAVAVTASNFMR